MSEEKKKNNKNIGVIEVTPVGGDKFKIDLSGEEAFVEVLSYTDDEKNGERLRDDKILVQVKFKTAFGENDEKTDLKDETLKLSEWNSITNEDKEYRDVEVTMLRGDKVLRHYTIPKMFITYFSEKIENKKVVLEMHLMQKEGYFEDLAVSAT